jgi:hypothetical protein
MSFKDFITEDKDKDTDSLNESAPRVIGIYNGIGGDKKLTLKLIGALNKALLVNEQWLSFSSGSMHFPFVEMTIQGADGQSGTRDVDPKVVVREVMKKFQKSTKGGYWYIDGSLSEW